MRHLTKNRADRLRIERRAIRRDTLEHQVTSRQGRLQPPQKSRDVVMIGLVIEDLGEHPFILPIIDD